MIYTVVLCGGWAEDLCNVILQTQDIIERSIWK
jgi:hypothetical protein